MPVKAKFLGRQGHVALCLLVNLGKRNYYFVCCAFQCLGQRSKIVVMPIDRGQRREDNWVVAPDGYIGAVLIGQPLYVCNGMGRVNYAVFQFAWIASDGVLDHKW